VPGVVGVPLIVPVDGSIDSPGGRFAAETEAPNVPGFGSPELCETGRVTLVPAWVFGKPGLTRLIVGPVIVSTTEPASPASWLNPACTVWVVPNAELAQDEAPPPPPPGPPAVPAPLPAPPPPPPW
jgi:hypothetical protein